jgi:ribosomal protein S12 methylthiotransferase accessory factor YcaO
MNRIRLILHRIFRRPAITDPMPIHTRRIPDGLLLDFEDYFVYAIETIADDEELLALFLEIVDNRAMSREHDGWTPEQLLVEQLAERVGHEVPIRGKALAALAERLRSGVPASAVVIPAQRREGGAAA